LRSPYEAGQHCAGDSHRKEPRATSTGSRAGSELTSPGPSPASIGVLRAIQGVGTAARLAGHGSPPAAHPRRRECSWGGSSRLIASQGGNMVTDRKLDSPPGKLYNSPRDIILKLQLDNLIGSLPARPSCRSLPQLLVHPARGFSPSRDSRPGGPSSDLGSGVAGATRALLLRPWGAVRARSCPVRTSPERLRRPGNVYRGDRVARGCQRSCPGHEWAAGAISCSPH
jgi:hypothetical protein